MKRDVQPPTKILKAPLKGHLRKPPLNLGDEKGLWFIHPNMGNSSTGHMIPNSRVPMEGIVYNVPSIGLCEQ